MAIYKTKWFDKWALKNNLVDVALCKAAEELADDLYDASLGGSVYKKRVGIANRGKSAGVRTLIAFRKDKNIFFMYGFAKNQQANIKANELKALRLLAKQLLSYNEQELGKAINAAELIEVVDDE